jgi:hypothetical protein
VASIWCDVDTEGAVSWVRRFPVGKEKDDTLSAMASRLCYQDPEAALSMALAIRDPAARLQSVESAVPLWMQADEGAARKWIQSANLPTDLKQRLLLGEGASPPPVPEVEEAGE